MPEPKILKGLDILFALVLQRMQVWI